LDELTVRTWQDAVLLLVGYRFHVRTAYADGENIHSTLSVFRGTWLSAEQLDQTPGKGGESQTESQTGHAMMAQLAEEFKLLVAMMLSVTLTSLYRAPGGGVHFQVTANSVTRIPFQLEYIATQLHALKSLFQEIFGQPLDQTDEVLQDLLRGEVEPGATLNPTLDIHRHPPFLRLLRGSSTEKEKEEKNPPSVHEKQEKEKEKEKQKEKETAERAAYFNKLLALHERITRPGWPDRLRAAGVSLLRDYMRGTSSVASLIKFFLPVQESVMIPGTLETFTAKPPVRMAIERLLQTWPLEVVGMEVLRALAAPPSSPEGQDAGLLSQSPPPPLRKGSDTQLLQWYLANAVLNWADYALDHGLLATSRSDRTAAVTAKTYTDVEVQSHLEEFTALYTRVFGPDNAFPWDAFLGQQREIAQWCATTTTLLDQWIRTRNTPTLVECQRLVEQPGPSYMARSAEESNSPRSPLWLVPKDKPSIAHFPRAQMEDMYQSFRAQASVQMPIMAMSFAQQRDKARKLEAMLTSARATSAAI